MSKFYCLKCTLHPSTCGGILGLGLKEAYYDPFISIMSKICTYPEKLRKKMLLMTKAVTSKFWHNYSVYKINMKIKWKFQKIWWHHRILGKLLFSEILDNVMKLKKYFFLFKLDLYKNIILQQELLFKKIKSKLKSVRKALHFLILFLIVSMKVLIWNGWFSNGNEN